MLRLVNITRNSKGFSLVEVIIAMVIGLIGAMGSYALLASMHGTRAENMAVLQAQQEARNIMERVTRELRESSPEVVWPDWEDWEDSEWVYFFTPRNANREFMVNPEGEPEWQQAIAYWLDSLNNTLYRYRYYLTWDPVLENWFEFEVVSKNVEDISFRRVNDMITINIRTFSDNDGGIGQTARSHSELTTTIQLRN